MTHGVRIPADVDREDRILAGFTARQIAVMAIAGVALYGGWQVTRWFLPVIVYLVVAGPAGVAVVMLVCVRRDGLTLDRLLWAALRQRMRPKRRVAAEAAPEAVPEWLAAVASESEPVDASGVDMPACGVDEAGLIDLGRDGVRLVAACSTVNFALRTPAEQDALVASFGRYLHSLTAPMQILIRAQRLDLTDQITDLRHRAASLPHPALENAALDHVEYLEQLSEQTDLLRRQVLLVIREPLRTEPHSTPGRSRRFSSRARNEDSAPSDGAYRAAASRLLRRMNEAAELLSAAGITVTSLDAAQATAVLTTATNPDSILPPSAELAGADEVITTTPAANDEEL